MSFYRNYSLFSPSKSLTGYISDTFNWLYEHSPINFSTLTGWHHPSMARLSGHPLLGRTAKMTEDGGLGFAKEIDLLSQRAKADRNGRAYCSLGPAPLLLLTSPSDIAQVLLYNEDKIDRGSILLAFGKIFGEHNLFTLPNNAIYKEKRSKILEALIKDQSLTQLTEPMQKIIDEHIEKLQDDGTISSLEKFMVWLTMDVFARTELAADPLTHAKEISESLGRVLAITTNPMNSILIRILNNFPIEIKTHLDQEKIILQAVIRQLLFEPNQTNLREKKSLLKECFDRHPVTHEAFAEAMQDAVALLFAGHETTARLLQFCLIMLAKNPHLLNQLRQEIDGCRPSHNQWGKNDLDKMDYLGKIIKETLRLYPPFPIIARLATKKFILADIPICKNRQEYEEAMANRDTTKDVVINPDTAINISPWVTQRLESIYEKPLEFDPERHKTGTITFGQRNMQNDDDDFFYNIPFGLGSRSCPGRKFSEIEAKLALIKLVDQFDFEISIEGHKNEDDLETYIRGSLKLKNEVEVKFTPRSSTLNHRI